VYRRGCSSRLLAARGRGGEIIAVIIEVKKEKEHY
jgi:hypothetical protein